MLHPRMLNATKLKTPIDAFPNSTKKNEDDALSVLLKPKKKTPNFVNATMQRKKKNIKKRMGQTSRVKSTKHR
jgi:hypothetical protein